MIRWNVAKAAKDRGWENANQLARGAGLSYPVAARLLAGEPLERIDVATLELLASVFSCEPWALLTWSKK